MPRRNRNAGRRSLWMRRRKPYGEPPMKSLLSIGQRPAQRGTVLWDEAVSATRGEPWVRRISRIAAFTGRPFSEVARRINE